jgi:protein-S-isoprenylcysteine O-methyltransferase Ste14
MRPFLGAQPIFTALFTCTVLLWIASEVLQGLRRRTNATNTDRYSLMVVRVCVTAGVFLAVLAQRVSAAQLPYTPLILALSLVLLWCGVALRWWCFRTLGRYFTFTVMTSSDQQVITTGPYKFLRHPSYAAMLVALTGIGLTFGNWLSLFALLVLAGLGFINRIRVEEAALAAALGARYTTYASTRKRLVPYVW